MVLLWVEYVIVPAYRVSRKLWRQGRRLVRRKVKRPLARALPQGAAIRKQPLTFSLSVAALASASGSTLVQASTEDFYSFDLYKIGVASSVGLAYFGCWNFYFYSLLMPYVLSGTVKYTERSLVPELTVRRGFSNLVKQMLLEFGVNSPIFFFPLLYTFQELSNFSVTPRQKVQSTILVDNYVQRFPNDYKDYMIQWMPIQLFNFSFVPLWLRAPFISIAHLACQGYKLSAERSRKKTLEHEVGTASELT
mmetsp:Transcript_14484/g.16923  ORF Transcript_14484/g.16923 Transcript_14484/m.16923 type:complete len:250 (+) Transcript_14484:218-967(+)